MNINFMKYSAYILCAILFFLSKKDLKTFYDFYSESKEKELVTYIHRCEIRIGILLFFLILNSIVIATYLDK